MIIDEVFSFLNNSGSALTHASFSTHYLGHSSRYYDYLRCSGAAPSIRALVRLAARLADLAHQSTDQLDKTETGRLARRVMAQAFARCV
ncbi:DUF6626 family protein [Blastomonas sp.]|uniref:DUF6626 family protein n=1 Tax=Blastomonas sp. TaxID=1909299 RepID=UPI00406A9F52